MLLAEPQPTQWDLHFRLLGVPVRITPFFWLANALLGWSFAQGVAFASGGELSLGVGLLIWILAVLVSILVHEFGHALTFRYFGVDAAVVLYHFGGLAVPRGTFGFSRQRGQDPKRQIMISVAGPAAQLLLAVVVGGALHAGGYAVGNPLWFIPGLDFLDHGEQLPSLAMGALVAALMWCSVWWALMNLLPVYPLDGGQISREVFTLFHAREGIRYSLILSIATGAAVAVWAFSRQDNFLGIMFGLLAYSSYTTFQAYSGRGGGFGGGPW